MRWNVEVLVESGPATIGSGPTRIGLGLTWIGSGPIGSRTSDVKSGPVGLGTGSPYNHPPFR